MTKVRFNISKGNSMCKGPTSTGCSSMQKQRCLSMMLLSTQGACCAEQSCKLRCRRTDIDGLALVVVVLASSGARIVTRGDLRCLGQTYVHRQADKPVGFEAVSS